MRTDTSIETDLSSEPAILWQFAASHYAEKARWALDYKQVAHIRRSLLPGPHMIRVRAMTGQTQIPVLQLNGATMFDSTRIIAALEREYPDPPLYPSDPGERERALGLEEFFDEALGPYVRLWSYFMLMPHTATLMSAFVGHGPAHKRAMFRATFPMVRPVIKRMLGVSPDNARAAREKIIGVMDRIAAESRRSGYLVGSRFTVADLTAAALLSPLLTPKEFQYGPQEMPRAFIEAREQFLDHPAFVWACGIYERHRGKSAAIAEEVII